MRLSDVAAPSIIYTGVPFMVLIIAGIVLVGAVIAFLVLKNKH